MRIGLRVAPRTSGGGKVFVDHIAEAINILPGGHEVTVFTMGASDSYAAPGQVPVSVPTHPLGRRLQGNRALSEAVRDHPVDVIVSPGTEIGVVAGVPSVMWPLTVAPFESAALRQLGRSTSDSLRWKALRAGIRQAARAADAFVFSSHYARALYRDNVPAIIGKPTTVIAPAASLPGGAEGMLPPGLPDRFVLFVSHLYPYKMVRETVLGFAQARNAGIEQHLVIAGNETHPEYAASVRALVDAHGLGDVVHFLGGVGQDVLPSLYRACDLYLFPSISENAGSYALIDAFLMGRPVLSSSLSSMPEACQDAVRYFDPRDPDQLGRELHRTLTMPGELTRLAERSRARGAEFQDWEGIAHSLVEFAHNLRQPPGA